MQSDIAVSRTTSEPVSERARFFAFLDALRDSGQSCTLINETDNRGSRDSLIVYCAIHSIKYECSERMIGPQPTWFYRAEIGGAIVEVQVP